MDSIRELLATIVSIPFMEAQTYTRARVLQRRLGIDGLGSIFDQWGR